MVEVYCFLEKDNRKHKRRGLDIVSPIPWDGPRWTSQSCPRPSGFRAFRVWSKTGENWLPKMSPNANLVLGCFGGLLSVGVSWFYAPMVSWWLGDCWGLISPWWSIPCWRVQQSTTSSAARTPYESGAGTRAHCSFPRKGQSRIEMVQLKTTLTTAFSIFSCYSLLLVGGPWNWKNLPGESHDFHDWRCGARCTRSLFGGQAVIFGRDWHNQTPLVLVRSCSKRSERNGISL